MSESQTTQAAADPQAPLQGFLNTVAALFATLADITYTRLELLFLDLQEASAHMLSVLLWSLIGLFAVAMTLLLGALALILVFWDTHRVLVAVLVTSVFAALALMALLMIIRKTRQRQPLFAATLEELAKDREHFTMRP